MDLRTYLSQGTPLVFDGAMGTYYASLPGRAEARCERASLDHPEEISAIHRAYLEAGCKAIKTNTFGLGGSSSSCLLPFGQGSRRTFRRIRLR